MCEDGVMNKLSWELLQHIQNIFLRFEMQDETETECVCDIIQILFPKIINT